MESMTWDIIWSVMIIPLITLTTVWIVGAAARRNSKTLSLFAMLWTIGFFTFLLLVLMDVSVEDRVIIKPMIKPIGNTFSMALQSIRSLPDIFRSDAFDPLLIVLILFLGTIGMIFLVKALIKGEKK